MPSLSDSLDALRVQSEQIAYLTSLNARPSGPFVQAYLGLGHGQSSRSANVLSLIRDASDSERRLFKFVGESDAYAPGLGGGNKRVEKREGGVVTPLKDLKVPRGGGGSGRDDMEVMLRTAMRLVDDYRPMPRARAHIINLLETHHKQSERLAELERLIAEATRPQPAPSSSNTATKPSGAEDEDEDEDGDDGGSTPKAKLSPEEAIKAEEAALRALEASIQPLRASAQSQCERTRTPSPPPQAQVQQTPFGSRTPVSSSTRTPGREMPHVTNSLVTNGMTPRRIDRFSPLKFIGTPRAPIGSSGLRNTAGVGAEEGPEKRTIFGRVSSLARSTSGSGPSRPSVLLDQNQTPASTMKTPVAVFDTPAASGAGTAATMDEDEDEDQAQGQGQDGGDDETIRIPRPKSPLPQAEDTVHTPESPTHSQIETEEAPTLADQDQAEEADSGSRTIGGVHPDAEGVGAGIAKIWATLGDMMRQGTGGSEVTQEVESSLKHLYNLSQSNPPPPPSPSSSSTSSALLSGAGAGDPKPITIETILFAHLFLLILRSFSTAAAGVDMNEVKETLNSISKARGWDATTTGGGGGLGTKIIYAAVGKRVVRIDRKGGGSGRVRFAE